MKKGRMPIAIAITHSFEDKECVKDIFINDDDIGYFKMNIESFDINIKQSILNIDEALLDYILLDKGNNAQKDVFNLLKTNIESNIPLYLYIIYSFKEYKYMNNIEKEIYYSYNARLPKNRENALSINSHVSTGEYMSL